MMQRCVGVLALSAVLAASCASGESSGDASPDADAERLPQASAVAARAVANFGGDGVKAGLAVAQGLDRGYSLTQLLEAIEDDRLDADGFVFDADELVDPAGDDLGVISDKPEQPVTAQALRLIVFAGGQADTAVTLDDLERTFEGDVLTALAEEFPASVREQAQTIDAHRGRPPLGGVYAVYVLMTLIENGYSAESAITAVIIGDVGKCDGIHGRTDLCVLSERPHAKPLKVLATGFEGARDDGSSGDSEDVGDEDIAEGDTSDFAELEDFPRVYVGRGTVTENCPECEAFAIECSQASPFQLTLEDDGQATVVFIDTPHRTSRDQNPDDPVCRENPQRFFLGGMGTYDAGVGIFTIDESTLDGFAVRGTFDERGADGDGELFQIEQQMDGDQVRVNWLVDFELERCFEDCEIE